MSRKDAKRQEATIGFSFDWVCSAVIQNQLPFDTHTKKRSIIIESNSRVRLHLGIALVQSKPETFLGVSFQKSQKNW